MKKKMLIAFHDDRLRQALSFLFGAEPRAQIAGSSNDSAGLLALAQVTSPDLILMDWDLASSPESDLITELRHINPEVKTIVFSEPKSERVARSGGADVCITKGSSPDVIIENFRMLFQLPS
jgi:DNA-binding NarL/FixJ family response regulator